MNTRQQSGGWGRILGARRQVRGPLLAWPAGVLLVVLHAGAALSVAHGQTDEEVSAARARGVRFLKERQKSEGHWEFSGHDTGITALCTIALVENGVPLTDPVVQNGYEHVKKNALELKNTYDVSLAIVLLHRMGDRRDKPLIKSLAARLIAGQRSSGGWHYDCPGRELDEEKVLRDPAQGPKPKEGYGDNSCTQFAVLGLWVASRSGVNIEKPLAKVTDRFTRHQGSDGGWGYALDNAGKPSGSTPSMTGAGLFSLAVAKAWEIRQAQKSRKGAEGASAGSGSLLADEAFSRGLSRTGEFVKGVGPGAGRYFLWSVERVGVLLGLPKFGEVDWFQTGAAALLRDQKLDGGWPSAWSQADPDGLSDTCLALLFLRKANLGSDISRLLEGEHELKFQIVDRQPAARWATLEEAVAAANPGETIRIDGNGPWKLGHLEIDKPLVVQAGFGYAPVFKHEVGRNRLGIRLKPETDPEARDMITVAKAQVTLEGLRLQMDPPKLKSPVDWRVITVKSGALRLLNCALTEGNRQETAGILLESAGVLMVRNSLLSASRAAVHVAPQGRQEVRFENSVAFGPLGFLVRPSAAGSAQPDLLLRFQNSAFQVRELLHCAKLEGTIEIEARASVFQADWIGSNLLTAADQTRGRGWNGALNLYDVKQWVGAAGKPAGPKDLKGWLRLWGNTEKDAFARVAPFVGLRQIGNYSHDLNAQDWQIELPESAEPALRRARVGVNAYLAGPGTAFDQFRETIDYSNWVRGGTDLAAEWKASGGLAAIRPGSAAAPDHR